MLVPLENAAKAFAVPFDRLYKALQSEHRALQYLDRVLCVQLRAVVKVLGVSGDDFKNMRAGREWFLSERDIVENYGDLYHNDPVAFKRIAGEQVLDGVIDVPVYRASPFIKLAMMSAEDRAEFLEELNGGTVGSRKQAEGKPVRGSDERPRQDDPPRRNRRGLPKRLGTRRPRRQ